MITQALRPFRPSVLGMALLFTTSLAAQTHAQSLWDQRIPSQTNSITSVRAARPGDILYVLITENTAVDNKDTRLMNKQTSADSTVKGDIGFSGFVGTADGGLDSSEETDASRSLNANSQYKSSRGIQDRMAVTVVDIDQNGNLLVAGEKISNLEGDQRKLVVSGVVRAIDIENDNTISSRSAANLRIHYESNGPETKFINQGWLGKKLNKWLPF